MLDGIVDPHTVVVDVEWWVEDQLVIEESFNLKARSSGILQPQFWKMGQTVGKIIITHFNVMPQSLYGCQSGRAILNLRFP